MMGPSSANMPGLLVFSGADYTTSGRITALALDPACTSTRCRVWVGAAGGGIWRTTNGLAGAPTWTFVSGSFATNAIGALTYDAASDTLWAGTGEPNASADSEAGMGLYRSTDGGGTWAHVAALTTTSISGAWVNKDAFLNRAISQITVDPTNSNVIYVSSASAIRGVCSVLNGCDAAPPTPLPARGVYKSTDGGATFTLLNGTSLPFVARGAVNVVLDPTDPNIVYASQFGQGVYRSNDGGANWTQIFAPVNPTAAFIERDSIAVAHLPNGKTRMYVGAGDNGTFAARLYRSDDAATGAPTFANLTNTQSAGYCTAQCWYDNVVYSPPGQPDTVYLGGSYDYSNAGTWAIDQNLVGRTNGRAYIVSKDGGASFNDLTRDATSDTTPNGMHPDSHAIAVLPSNPNVVFFGSDGGLVRTSGSFADISSQCAFAWSQRGQPGDLPATSLERPDADLQPEQGPLHAAVSEPVGQPDRPEEPDGWHAGQRHVDDDRLERRLEHGHLGRRRSVRLQRRQPGLPLQHVHRPGERRQLPRRQPRKVGRDHR